MPQARKRTRSSDVKVPPPLKAIAVNSSIPSAACQESPTQCRISFTGFVCSEELVAWVASASPRNGSSQRTASALFSTLEEYKELAQKLGATVDSNLTTKTSVLVAWRGLTAKRVAASKAGIPVVTPLWLESQGKLEMHSCTVPVLYGYVFCITRFSPEEENALGSIVRQHGGTLETALSGHSDALLVTHEVAQELRGLRPPSVSSAPPSSRAGDDTDGGKGGGSARWGEVVSAKIAFAWENDIPVVDCQRFLMMALHEHGTTTAMAAALASHAEWNKDFDGIIRACCVPAPALTSTRQDWGDSGKQRGDEGFLECASSSEVASEDGSAFDFSGMDEESREAEGSQSRIDRMNGVEGDDDESGELHSALHAGYEHSATVSRGEPLPRDTLQTIYGDESEAGVQLEDTNTSPVTHPDFYSATPREKTESAMYPSSALEACPPFYYERKHQRAVEQEDVIAKAYEQHPAKHSLQKQLGIVVYNEEQGSALSSVPLGDKSSAVRGFSMVSSEDSRIPSLSLAKQQSGEGKGQSQQPAAAILELPRVPLYPQSPPYLSVTLLGCSQRELHEAARVCLLCRFMRMPLPTARTDVIVLGSEMVKKKRYVKPSAAAALNAAHTPRALALRQQQQHQQILQKQREKTRVLYFYECDAEVLSWLHDAFGIPKRHVVPLAWLRECQKRVHQKQHKKASSSSLFSHASATESLDANKTAEQQWEESGRSAAEETLSEPPRDTMCLDTPIIASQPHTEGSKDFTFHPEPPLSLEQLPDLYAKEFRVFPKVMHGDKTVEVEKIEEQEQQDAPADRQQQWQKEDSSSVLIRDNDSCTDDVKRTDSKHLSSASTRQQQQPPQQSNSGKREPGQPRAVPSSALQRQPLQLTEEESYQQDRARAKTMLDSLLRILAPSFAAEPPSSSAAGSRGGGSTGFTSMSAMPLPACSASLSMVPPPAHHQQQLLSGIPAIFNHCSMCFVEGEFSRPDLAVVRGLVNLGGGSWIKKTDAEWRVVLSKKAAKTRAAGEADADSKTETVRLNAVFGKGSYRQKLTARGWRGEDTQDMLASMSNTGKSGCLSGDLSMSAAMGPFISTLADPPQRQDGNVSKSMSVSLVPLDQQQQRDQRMSAIAGACAQAPALHVVPHYMQRAPVMDCSGSGSVDTVSKQGNDSSSTTKPESSPSASLKYLCTVTSDYLLACLACHAMVNPHSFFLFCNPIPSGPDMQLLQHARRQRQQEKQQQQKKGKVATAAKTLPSPLDTPPALSPWVWKRRYAKANSVGVTVAFLWCLHTSHLYRMEAEEEGEDGFTLGKETLAPSPQAVALMRVLLFALRSAVLALNGSIVEAYDASAVTHVVVVDVAAVISSSLSSLYGVSPSALNQCPPLPPQQDYLIPSFGKGSTLMNALPQGFGDDEKALMFPLENNAAVPALSDGEREQQCVYWPCEEQRAAAQDAANGSVSLVNCRWLEDCLQWGIFVEESDQRYAPPSEVSLVISTEASEQASRHGGAEQQTAASDSRNSFSFTQRPLPSSLPSVHSDSVEELVGKVQASVGPRMATTAANTAGLRSASSLSLCRRAPHELQQSIRSRLHDMHRSVSVSTPHMAAVRTPPRSQSKASSVLGRNGFEHSPLRGQSITERGLYNGSPDKVPARGVSRAGRYDCNDQTQSTPPPSTPPPLPEETAARAATAMRVSTPTAARPLTNIDETDPMAAASHGTPKSQQQQKHGASPLRFASRARSHNTQTLQDQHTADEYLLHLTEVFNFTTPGSTPVPRLRERDHLQETGERRLWNAAEAHHTTSPRNSGDTHGRALGAHSLRGPDGQILSAVRELRFAPSGAGDTAKQQRTPPKPRLLDFHQEGNTATAVSRDVLSSRITDVDAEVAHDRSREDKNKGQREEEEEQAERRAINTPQGSATPVRGGHQAQRLDSSGKPPHSTPAKDRGESDNEADSRLGSSRGTLMLGARVSEVESLQRAPVPLQHHQFEHQQGRQGDDSISNATNSNSNSMLPVWNPTLHSDAHSNIQLQPPQQQQCGNVESATRRSHCATHFSHDLLDAGNDDDNAILVPASFIEDGGEELRRGHAEIAEATSEATHVGGKRPRGELGVSLHRHSTLQTVDDDGEEDRDAVGGDDYSRQERGKRPRLEAASVSPPPRQVSSTTTTSTGNGNKAVVIDVDEEEDTNSRTMAISSTSRHISLARRPGGVSPIPASPTAAVAPAEDVHGKPQEHRHAEHSVAAREPLKFYVLHDVPSRKTLVRRCQQAMSRMPPTLQTSGNEAQQSSTSRATVSVAQGHEHGAGHPEAVDTTAPSMSSQASAVSSSLLFHPASQAHRHHPVVFVKQCEEADVVVTHELTPRETILSSIAAGKWVVRPAALEALATQLERATTELSSSDLNRNGVSVASGGGGTLPFNVRSPSPVAHLQAPEDWLEAHEWCPEYLPREAPVLNASLAKQCRLLRRAWQLRRRRIFDGKAFLLCFSSSPAAVSSSASTDASHSHSLSVPAEPLQPGDGAEISGAVKGNTRAQGEPPMQGNAHTAATAKHKLEQKVTAVQRLILAGGGTVCGVVRLSWPSGATEREEGKSMFYYLGGDACTRTGVVDEGSAELSSSASSSSLAWDSVALAEDLTLLLCGAILQGGASHVDDPLYLCSSVSSAQRIVAQSALPAAASPRMHGSLELLIDSTLLDAGVSMGFISKEAAEERGQAQLVQLRSWLSEMFTDSTQLQLCLHNAHEHAFALWRQWAEHSGGNRDVPKHARSFNVQLPVLPLCIMEDPVQLRSLQACTSRRLQGALSRLKKSATEVAMNAMAHQRSRKEEEGGKILGTPGEFTSSLAHVSTVSIRCMSWLGLYVSGGSTLADVPSLCLGELNI